MGEDAWPGFGYSGSYEHNDWGSDDDCYNGEHEPSHGNVRQKTCKICGVTGLKWGRYNGSWRFFKDEKLHICSTINPEYTGKPTLEIPKKDAKRIGDKLRSVLQSNKERIEEMGKPQKDEIVPFHNPRIYKSKPQEPVKQEQPTKLDKFIAIHPCGTFGFNHLAVKDMNLYDYDYFQITFTDSHFLNLEFYKKEEYVIGMTRLNKGASGKGQKGGGFSAALRLFLDSNKIPNDANLRYFYTYGIVNNRVVCKINISLSFELFTPKPIDPPKPTTCKEVVPIISNDMSQKVSYLPIIEIIPGPKCITVGDRVFSLPCEATHQLINAVQYGIQLGREQKKQEIISKYNEFRSSMD